MKYRAVGIFVVLFIIMGLSNPVLALSQSNTGVYAKAAPISINADGYSVVYGVAEDIFVLQAPNLEGVQISEESGGWGSWKMELQWLFSGVPTDKTTYYLKFYVVQNPEWFKVYYWYNIQWVYLGTVTGTGYLTFTIATPQSSYPSFCFMDGFRSFDFANTTWKIGWTYLDIY